MRLGKELTGKSIVSLTDGRILGTVKDLYVDNTLTWLVGIQTGSEGFLKRKSLLIDRTGIHLFGIDVILVKHSGVITDDEQHEPAAEWVKLSKLRGRDVDTPGGTKVGTIGDIVIDQDGRIIGFGLARTYVAGPIAAVGTISREALLDTGAQDGALTVDLTKAEQLKIE